MFFLRALHTAAGPQAGAAGGVSWTAEPVFWLGVASLAALVVIAVGVWALDVHLREVREEARRLGTLEEIDQKLGRVLAERGDLDLRRLEHVLIDLRDGQRRLEDAMLQVLERGATSAATGSLGAAASDALVPVSPESMSERITNRLLALGYERIQLVARPDEIAALANSDGEVLVEARKDGALHKGRVVVQGGRIADVDTNPAYSIFP